MFAWAHDGQAHMVTAHLGFAYMNKARKSKAHLWAGLVPSRAVFSWLGKNAVGTRNDVS